MSQQHSHYLSPYINSHQWIYDYDNLYNTIDSVVKESIKCHHNDISKCIYENLHEQDQSQFCDRFCSTIIDSLNFFFFPNEIDSLISKPRNKEEFNLSKLRFSLSQIAIPSFVALIGQSAFSECSSLTKVAISSSVTKIDNSAFEDCSSLIQFEIPSSVTSIREFVFKECISLKLIMIPSSVTSIERAAFSGLSSLEQITIPSSVISIGYPTFVNCSSLIQIEILDSLKIIDYNTFFECSSLKEILIPSSVIIMILY